jgi:hypothetical protein
MWSGPRNISTALMRAWENRFDAFVIDEPFYGHYLKETGLDHPGAEDIIAEMETDWRKVVSQIISPPPDGAAIFYQKHMTHHMLDHIARDWLRQVTNCFLIREPSRVLISLSKVLPNPTIEQSGFPQQAELFRVVQKQSGGIPPVIDARDVLMNPRRVLAQLCERVGAPFDDSMLSWPAGPRDSDGVWAKYWYASVEQSTGFAPYEERDESVPDHLRHMLAECNAIYEELAAHRLR